MKCELVLITLMGAALLAAGNARAQPAGNCKAVADAAYKDWSASPDLASCAKSGSADAEAILGMMYFSASTCQDEDCRRALMEELGHPASISSRQLSAEGLRLLRAASAKGESSSSNEIGNAYLSGEYGMPQNSAEAHRWLLKSTADGDDIGPFNVARMYLGGLGIEQSTDVGMRYLYLSAQRGYWPARCTLIELNERKNVFIRIANDILTFFGTRQCAHYDIMKEIN